MRGYRYGATSASSPASAASCCSRSLPWSCSSRLVILFLFFALQAWEFSKEITFLTFLAKQEPSRRRIQSTVPRPSASQDFLSKSDQTTPLPLCSRRQILDGRWSPAYYEKPPYVSKNVKLQCHNETYYDEHGYHTFNWHPTDRSCEFRRWNATGFCYLVQRATVSIIGDSLSWEMYSSLMQLIGVRVHQLDQHRSKSDQTNIVLKGCWPKTRFVYRNDPRLEFVRESIIKDFPVVLVLNRGPHYSSDSELTSGMRETVRVLDEWRTTCEQLGWRCHLFWRTSVPGHPRCNRTDDPGDGDYGRAYFRQPDNSLDRVESWIGSPSNYDETTVQYHWYDFQHQNNLILQILEESGLNATILDAYYLNVRRVDGHRMPNDCLHNCYPGKMDVLNQLLLHFLSSERTDRDVEHLQSLYWEAYERVRGPEATTARLAKYNLTAEYLSSLRNRRATNSTASALSWRL